MQRLFPTPRPGGRVSGAIIHVRAQETREAFGKDRKIHHDIK
jgi:hypothetical protein